MLATGARGSRRAGPPRPAAAEWGRADPRGSVRGQRQAGTPARAPLPGPGRVERSGRGRHRAGHDRSCRWPARRRGRPAVPAGPRRGSPGGRSGRARPSETTSDDGRAAQINARPRRRPLSASAQVARETSRSPESPVLPTLAFACVCIRQRSESCECQSFVHRPFASARGRGMEKGMSWEESMFAVFDDLEQQARGLHLVERDARGRGPHRSGVLPTSASRPRLHASLGQELRVATASGAHVRHRSAGPARRGLVPAGRRRLRVGGASPGSPIAGLPPGRTVRTPGRWSTG